MRSVPCAVTGPCTAPVSVVGLGTDCSGSSAAAALTQSLQDLGSPLTALNLSTLTAVYLCVPTVNAALPSIELTCTRVALSLDLLTRYLATISY